LGGKKLDCLFEIVYLKLTDILQTHVGEIISKQKNKDDKMETKHDFLGWLERMASYPRLHHFKHGPVTELNFHTPDTLGVLGLRGFHQILVPMELS
jgi:hypothetical protein